MLKSIFRTIIRSRQKAANEYIARYRAIHNIPDIPDIPETPKTDSNFSKISDKSDLELVEHNHKKGVLWFWVTATDKVVSPLFETEADAILWKKY